MSCPSNVYPPLPPHYTVVLHSAGYGEVYDWCICASQALYSYEISASNIDYTLATLYTTGGVYAMVQSTNTARLCLPPVLVVMGGGQHSLVMMMMQAWIA